MLSQLNKECIIIYLKIQSSSVIALHSHSEFLFIFAKASVTESGPDGAPSITIAIQYDPGKTSAL